VILAWLCTALASTIDDAIARRLGGDLAGARALLEVAEPTISAAERADYLYQRGICEELSGDLVLAENDYRQAIDASGGVLQDARFRLALVLEAGHRDAEAMAQLRVLDRSRGLDPGDHVTLELQRGVTQLAMGRRAAGTRTLTRALAADLGTSDRSYMRAKAHAMLAGAEGERAAGLVLTGSEKRVVRRLEKRGAAIRAIEGHVVAMAKLQEPEWVLQGTLVLGDAYAALSRDLAASPAPRRLDQAQSALYTAALAPHVDQARAKALHSYEQGISLARRLQWESPRVALLQARRDALEGGG
jgi:tetratricopeptide (TPR) repeat protein